MESIHWLLSSSTPQFLEMMEFENCLILLCEAKIKVLRRQKCVMCIGCEQKKKIQVEYCEKKFHVECIAEFPKRNEKKIRIT